MNTLRLALSLCLALVLSLSLAVPPAAPAWAADEDGGGDRDTIFQYSTIDALLTGHYDGTMTIGELMEHGDIGIGTFNHLNGEMVMLEGVVYQVKVTGEARVVPEGTRSPFAVVTHFEPDRKAAVPEGLDLDGLKTFLDGLVGNPNHFHAIRIDGVFARMSVRSVPAQKPPYRPLSEVVREQAVFEHENVEGSVVGFRLPTFMGGLNVPGYHLHFVTRDRTQGGHVLGLATTAGAVGVDEASGFAMQLPQDAGFGALDLTRERGTDLYKVESKGNRP